MKTEVPEAVDDAGDRVVGEGHVCVRLRLRYGSVGCARASRRPSGTRGGEGTRRHTSIAYEPAAVTHSAKTHRLTTQRVRLGVLARQIPALRVAHHSIGLSYIKEMN